MVMRSTLASSVVRNTKIKTYANYPLLTDLNDTSRYANEATFSRASGATKLSSTDMTDVGSGVPIYLSTGLLVEPAHTNRILWSRNPANAAYVKVNCTATDNFATSLRGDTTAGKITASNTSAYVHATVNTKTTTGAFRVSRFVKKGTAAVNYVMLFLYGTGSTNGTGAWFNIDAGTVGTTFQDAGMIGSDHRCDDYGGGWYRISFLATAITVTSTSLYTRGTRINGGNSIVAGDYIIVDQLDVQDTTMLLSPIHTTTAAATVVKTDVTIPASHFPVNNFKIYADLSRPSNSTAGTGFIYTHATDANNSISISSSSTSTSTSIVRSGSSKSALVSESADSKAVIVTQSATYGLTTDVDGNSTNNATSTADLSSTNATAIIGADISAAAQYGGTIANLRVIDI